MWGLNTRTKKLYLVTTSGLKTKLLLFQTENWDKTESFNNEVWFFFFLLITYTFNILDIPTRNYITANYLAPQGC